MTQVNQDVLKASFTPLTAETMLENWSRLHAGDCEPLPQIPVLVEAWLMFHNGEFQTADKMAQTIEGGESLQLKARSTYAHYLEHDAGRKISQFKSIVETADKALLRKPANEANLHYQIAYSLGRYGLFISVAKALAEGIAGKISSALNTCLEMEPQHADAHTALGTYQAEIIGKLGRIAAKLTYSASSDDAETHYEQGVTLAPYSVSAKTEYADGLLSMFGKKKLKQATKLYEQSVTEKPLDALEALDTLIANQELAEA